MNILSMLSGDANKRYLKSLTHEVRRINEQEPAMASLTDDALRRKTEQFQAVVQKARADQQAEFADLESKIAGIANESEKSRLQEQLRQRVNDPLDRILHEAFAVVREAARRTLNQRHYDVQLIGGIVLHRGQVAEMKTGEGKTLVATLPVYLNALAGEGVHVITVNDYLARRDAVWMGQIYDFLGLTIGIITHEQAFLYDASHTTSANDAERDEGVRVESEFLRPVTRKEAYEADITYGTNNEFGFDYLRDNMVYALNRKVQRPLRYAIVDEVDSILIDEARTPLIISAPDTRSTDRYYQFAKLVEELVEKTDYTIDEKLRAASLTEAGIAKIEKSLGVENLYVEEGIQTVHHLEQALKAKSLFMKDREYAIKDGQVLIVDEFTGRLLQGRRYSEGLHQAIEAKEGLPIQQESKTMATITFQNYFRLYRKLAGMTGTAETEAEELAKIYALDVTTIPTNKPLIRKDMGDRVYKSKKAKYSAVVDEIAERHATGQPVLVGTISIEQNELLGQLLEQRGVAFNMLNAKHHDREAETIAQAGQKGSITVATNMAGRGVDIILGGKPFEKQRYEQVVALGGLCVLGTERHESRRIDNQLRGRAGRQGDPGMTRFYVSLEDDLMRIFGGDRARTLMKSWPDDMPIENPIISRSIESAQKKVEGHNFDIRKHLVEYDDVANKQRMYIYALRNKILRQSANEQDEAIGDARAEIVEEASSLLDGSVVSTTDQTPKADLLQSLSTLLALNESEKKSVSSEINGAQLTAFTNSILDQRFRRLSDAFAKSGSADAAPLAGFLASLRLRTIDLLWVEHLETIQYLRTGIGLRGYGQRDPVVEYKRESRDLFTSLLSSIRRQFVQTVMHIASSHVSVTPKAVAANNDQLRLQEQKATMNALQSESAKGRGDVISAKRRDAEGKKLGRNDPCYCGSGKKYKKCHGV